MPVSESLKVQPWFNKEQFQVMQDAMSTAEAAWVTITLDRRFHKGGAGATCEMCSASSNAGPASTYVVVGRVKFIIGPGFRISGHVDSEALLIRSEPCWKGTGPETWS